METLSFVQRELTTSGDIKDALKQRFQQLRGPARLRTRPTLVLFSPFTVSPRGVHGPCERPSAGTRTGSPFHLGSDAEQLVTGRRRCFASRVCEAEEA